MYPFARSASLADPVHVSSGGFAFGKHFRWRQLNPMAHRILSNPVGGQELMSGRSGRAMATIRKVTGLQCGNADRAAGGVTVLAAGTFSVFRQQVQERLTTMQRAMGSNRLPVYRALAVLAAAMFVAGTLTAQTVPATGFPQDWSHHHLVFSNPGTYEQAVQNGTVAKWLKITSDPRYIIQQRARSGVSAALPDVSLSSTSAPTRGKLKKDWNTNLGGFASTLVGTVAAPGSSDISGSSTLDVAGTPLSASPPTGASAKATFSGAALTGQTVTINPGTNLTLTVSGTAATMTGTFTSTSAAGTIDVVYNTNNGSPNTLSITPAATTGTVTFSGEPTAGDTITIGGTTYTWGSSSCSAPCVVRSGTNSTDAENLNEAVNNTCTSSSHCKVSGANASASAAWSGGSSTVTTITNSTSGTIAFSVSQSGTAETLYPSGGAISIGTTSGCASATAGFFVAAASATTQATNFTSAITACHTSYPAIGVTPTNQGSGAVKLTADAPGTAVTLASTGTSATGFSWAAPVAGTDGSNACTSSSAGTFINNGNGTTQAGYINTALNSTSCKTTYAVAVTSTTSTNTVTVTTTALGSGASLTVGASETDANVSWSSVAAGTDGTNSSTQFTYWQGSNYLSSAQVATNIANAVNSNTTLQGSSGVGAAANTPASGNVTFTANVIGTGSFVVTPTSFSAFTAGSLTAGSAAPTGTVQPNASPAKFSFSTTSATCSDFIVYPVGTAVASTSANIVAYNNIYASGGCAGQVPSVFWTYQTGGWVTTSPILSFDGSQVAFVQVSGTTPVASLVILKWAASTSGTLTTQASGSAYQSCTAPCMYTIAFSGSHNDTFSSPFYDYTHDELYVGDDSGNLHQFTGVFNGTPAESLTSGLPWVNLGSSKLSSPVYDSSSGYVIVGDFGGTLHSVTAATGVVHGTQTGVGDVIADAPLVDGSNGILFAFVTSGIYAYSGYNAVYELSTGFTGCTFGVSPCYPGVVALSTTNANSGYYLYAGTFDNVYYESSSPPSGNIYVVGNTGATTGGVLYRIGISGGGMTGVTSVATVTAAAHPWPSPATEFCNPTSAGTPCGALFASGSGCTVSTSSKTITCTTANFAAADVGAAIFGTDIPAGATVATYTSPTSITISANGTGSTSTGTVTVEVTTSGTDYLFFSVNRGTGCSSSGAGTGCILSYNVTNPASPPQAGSGLGVTTPITNGCWATGALVIDNSVPSGTFAGASQVYSVELNGSAAGYPGTLTNGGCTGTTTSAIIEGVQALQSSP
jgi:hypothetical protein